jgi:hypothetical protein
LTKLLFMVASFFSCYKIIITKQNVKARLMQGFFDIGYRPLTKF